MDYSSPSIFATRLVPEAAEPLPWNTDDMCPLCSPTCEHADHFYTPPQSPTGQGFNFARFEALNHLTVSVPSQDANYIDTPHYPHAPPSTPITTALYEQPLQFWSSDLYKTTINFPPSELPEHLHDGAWSHCSSPASSGEMTILFGPDAARPFSWTPSTEDNVLPKFVWGPLELLVRRSGGVSPPAIEPQVGDKAESTETTRSHEPTVDSLGPALDDLTLHSNEV